MVRARNPVVVVSRSGRKPASVTALVELCELLGLPPRTNSQEVRNEDICSYV